MNYNFETDKIIPGIENLDDETTDINLIRIYFEKAQNIKNQRNNIITLVTTGLIIKYAPTYSDLSTIRYYSVKFTSNYSMGVNNFEGQIIPISIYTHNMTIFGLMIALSFLFIWSYSEIKYRESIWNYQMLVVKKITRDITKTTKPTTYGELCKMVFERTYFPKTRIMRLITILFPPDELQKDIKEKVEDVQNDSVEK